MLNTMFKSVIDSDNAPIVICDINSTIVYMNLSAVERYGNLMGKSIKDCHNEKSNEMIERVLEWFRESKENNCIYTSHSERENKDIYMVALRDRDRNLIGYYEKHEFRDGETVELYHPR